MEAWKKVCFDAFFPLMSCDTLDKLRHALDTDDQRLQQGYTTDPPTLVRVQDCPVETVGCPIAFCGVLEGLETVGEVAEFFARICYEIDVKLGDPAGCRWLLNWYDEAPRDVVRSDMSRAITEYLARKKEVA